uniref:Retrovirus-related Pol polyprotein from transposon TNT 1-94 n=1 Tax=Rhizophora mucronata TaxID=61149 RepID=A0A2P2JW43_RHIMU
MPSSDLALNFPKFCSLFFTKHGLPKTLRYLAVVFFPLHSSYGVLSVLGFSRTLFSRCTAVNVASVQNLV